MGGAARWLPGQGAPGNLDAGKAAARPRGRRDEADAAVRQVRRGHLPGVPPGDPAQVGARAGDNGQRGAARDGGRGGMPAGSPRDRGAVPSHRHAEARRGGGRVEGGKALAGHARALRDAGWFEALSRSVSGRARSGWMPARSRTVPSGEIFNDRHHGPGGSLEVGRRQGGRAPRRPGGGPRRRGKRTRPDSNRRPNAPQAFALSKLCNESKDGWAPWLNLDCYSRTRRGRTASRRARRASRRWAATPSAGPSCRTPRSWCPTRRPPWDPGGISAGSSR